MTTCVTRWEGGLDRLFDEFWDRAPLAPALDVAETAEAIVLSAELPGMERKDIELTVKDGVLAIRGEKRAEEASEGRRLHRVERRYGAFHRALALPEGVDADRVAASFRNGVLTVTLPKRAETPPKAIDIQE